MRLNLFLPYRPTDRGGPLRRLFGWIGPSWLASPARRLAQILCLAVFLLLFFHVCWTTDELHFAQAMQAKEIIEAESFLMLDPLVSASTALAGRMWVRAIPWALALLAACLVIPRGFCAYVCPLGTLIDVVDWALGKARCRPNVAGRGWWVHLRYYLLAAVLASAACGVTVAGFFAAIPIATRALLFLLAPAQIGVVKGWHMVSAYTAGHVVSIAMFALILSLSLLGKRFWCRSLCPTGAVFSLASLLRLSDRQVTSSCVECGRCAGACSFGAVMPDFGTRAASCTFCQTCAGLCPAHAIRFGHRWDRTDRKPRMDTLATEPAVSRRGFFAGAFAGAAAAWSLGRSLGPSGGAPAVRPPGSVPEASFLRLCVRCGECIMACPSHVLQPSSFERGAANLWTPRAAPDWSGCAPTCNACGQVCPTGAIRALPLEEKRVVRMGRAIVNEATCLPHAGRQECQLCVDQCKAAGYDAIEFIHVGVEVDEDGMPIDGSGYLAPTIQTDKCVGCGLCQTRCYSINVKERALLQASAVTVKAGNGMDDRMMSGSYRQLRDLERRRHKELIERQQPKDSGGYLPDFLNEM